MTHAQLFTNTTRCHSEKDFNYFVMKNPPILADFFCNLYQFSPLCCFNVGQSLRRQPNTTTLQTTGASLLLHRVSPPHGLVLMYFSSQQLGKELPVDISPVVQQHTAYIHYGLLRVHLTVCAPLCVGVPEESNIDINAED